MARNAVVIVGWSDDADPGTCKSNTSIMPGTQRTRWASHVSRCTVVQSDGGDGPQSESHSSGRFGRHRPLLDAF